MKAALLGGLIIAAGCWAQTQLDLGTQSRNVDFSKAATTKPAKAGTVLPTTCSAGEMFVHLTSTTGSNLYVCSSPNFWSPANGGGPSSSTATALATATVATLPAGCSIGDVRFAGDAAVSGGGFYLYSCTALNTWTQFGYVGGGSGAVAANCSSLPCTIEVSDIVPLKAAANTWTGANDFSTAAKTAPFRIGASDPAACDPASREFFFNISSNALKSCNTANTWTTLGGGAAGSGVFGPGSPWAPFGWNVSSSGDIYAGDSPGAQVCAAVVPPLSATFTKVGLYVLSWPTSGGQGLSLGLYSAAGTRLGYASAPNPGSGSELVLTLDTPVSVTAGTLYFQCTATEGAATLMTAFSIYGGYFMSLTGNTDTLIFNGNPATGSGATFAVSSTMGARNGSTYHTAPLTVYLP